MKIINLGTISYLGGLRFFSVLSIKLNLFPNLTQSKQYFVRFEDIMVNEIVCGLLF